MLEKVKINSANLRPKIILAFVIVTLLVVVTGAVGYHGVGVVDKEAHIIAEDFSQLSDATTAERLSSLSATLREEVAEFKLDSTTAETLSPTPIVSATTPGHQPVTTTTDGGPDTTERDR